MYLYSLTLSRPTGIQCAIYGNFSSGKAQEIVISRGHILELLRPNDGNKLISICSIEVFGCIRSLHPFRLTGAPKDCILIGTDSGRLVILEFSEQRDEFIKIHQETFGRSGCRRIVPGQYLASDPKGRACMIAACEKNKFVYVLNRDNSANLTISSPLEAHKARHIVFAICGLDCGFENPVFAAIELDYENTDQDTTGEAASQAQKHITFYELDLGLNHVIRKSSEPVDNGSNLLIPVPGSTDGPGGVLVCAENFILHRNMESAQEVRTIIPRRSDLIPERGVLIISATMHKRKNMFFFLLQSEYGDIYKVTLEYNEETVSELKIRYFDTIPPCASICVLKTGYLFAASEFGNHALYQFLGTGDDGEDVETSSSSVIETEGGFHPVFFQPRRLKYLHQVDELTSLMPIIDAKVCNLLKEEIPQIYALCGRGSRSSMNILRPGLGVTELAVAPLPGHPTAIFTTKLDSTDDYDSYIIVSFQNATLIFSIGDEIKETTESGFLATSPTLSVQLLKDNSLLQVHPSGLRHIRPDRRINEWRSPGRSTITKSSTNESQVVISLSGGEVIYFELDAIGQLIETERKDMNAEVAALVVGPIPDGRQRSRFLAVATLDSTVRVLSLDPTDCLHVLAVQAVPAIAESLLFLTTTSSPTTPLFLQLGLVNGILLRTEIGQTTGILTDTRTRFLGTRGPKLFGVKVKGENGMLALTTRPWLGFSIAGRYSLVPLSYDVLDYAASKLCRFEPSYVVSLGFASDQCPEGFVAVSQNTLRIVSVENVGETFNQTKLKLKYTPRRFLVNEETQLLYVIQADHQIQPQEEETDEDMAMDIETEAESMTPAEQFGFTKTPIGTWASCLQVIDPKTPSILKTLPLDQDEFAVSLCFARFSNAKEGTTFLAIGSARRVRFYPLQTEAGFISVYRLTEDGTGFRFIHKTQVEGIPMALCGFRGKLLAGIGTSLRMYESGKKKLLKKCEYRRLPNNINSITTRGNRVYLGTTNDSFIFMKYKPSDNQFYTFADDISSRSIISSVMLDYDTVAAGDKFGNIFVARLPEDLSSQVEDDPTGGKLASMTGHLNGAPHRLDNIIQFHVGDIVTSLSVTPMQAGGQEIILYTTMMGSVGALVAFQSRTDVDFFQHLEMYMRQENPPLCGREHLSYRSSYFPVKDVIDGDLCEQFTTLPPAKQSSIAQSLDRTTGEVLKKLEKLRNKIL
eukprot:g2742.t1